MRQVDTIRKIKDPVERAVAAEEELQLREGERRELRRIQAEAISEARVANPRGAQSEIAQRLGVSRTRVSQLEKLREMPEFSRTPSGDATAPEEG